ncbi:MULTISPECIES: hypothetical protein [Caballeronia]|jgi:hypothetical protein|uniref:Uncharacterized protein n=3 Tax=Caballeronia TaxID=1827195 RepID=A0AA37ICB4_9BURK|nr:MULTISPECIES: hypothetical protein [Caballeronia]MBC8640879.1 hypothetical protein [Caballeronia sp. EK]GJH11865.1 hypothetical protein CBA19CS11_23525 [Caballeronia novacaledonica]GJH19319.1 hypothetical protein CBA19CS22_22275 [Caballeronia novacaledonica]GJH26738.1 hypothetical protein CBA19CS42_19500 [Caballeronia novacaledonica]
MTTHKKNQTAPRREAFRCTGAQLDALLRFAEERKLDDQPLHIVVAEYWRYQAHAKAA